MNKQVFLRQQADRNKMAETQAIMQAITEAAKATGKAISEAVEIRTSTRQKNAVVSMRPKAGRPSEKHLHLTR